MEIIETLIANVGFPVAVSIYLLVRLESKLETLTNSINELSSNIISLKSKYYYSPYHWGYIPPQRTILILP